MPQEKRPSISLFSVQSNGVLLTLAVLLATCLIPSVLTAQKNTWLRVDSPTNAPIKDFGILGKDLYVGYLGRGLFRMDEDRRTLVEVKEEKKSIFFVQDLATTQKSLIISTISGIHTLDVEGRITDRSHNLKGWSIYAAGSYQDQLFAGTKQGLYRLDREENWEGVSLPIADKHSQPRIYSILVNEENIYAGTDKMFFYSSDGGKSWKSSGEVTDYAITSWATDGTNIYFGTSGDGIHTFPIKAPELTIRFFVEGLETEQTAIPYLIYDKERGRVVNSTYNGGINSEIPELNSSLPELEIWSFYRFNNKLYAGTHGKGLLFFDQEGDGKTLGATISANTLSRNEAQLSLFPNPTSTELTVEINDRSGSKESVTCSVFDLHNRRIYNKELPLVGGLVTHKVDVRRFPPGTYLLSITRQQSVITSAKFIVSQ